MKFGLWLVVFTVKPPILKDTLKENNGPVPFYTHSIQTPPKENNLPTITEGPVPFYTHSIQTPPKEDSLSTKDKRLGPEHVHYSEVTLLYNKFLLVL